jgi:hypothetical protein
MPPPARAASPSRPPASVVPPPLQPPAPRSALTPGTVAIFTLILVAEAAFLVFVLRRIESPYGAIDARDVSRTEYIDLEAAEVPVRPAPRGLDVRLKIRVEASLLLEGSGAERTRQRDLVRATAPKLREEIARVIGELTADEAVDPGNRDLIKERLKQAMNRNVFQEDVAREVVLRYYGP